MRNVIITNDGNPFILNLWFKSYKSWSHLVDYVYISISTNISDEVLNSIKNIFKNDQKIKLIFKYKDMLAMHGEIICNALNKIEFGNVVILEDDIFIINPDFLDKNFKMLESNQYDIIGSTKLISAESDLKDYLKNIFNIDGGFFPSMLFFNIELYKKINEQFKIFLNFNKNLLRFHSEESALFTCTYNPNTNFIFLKNYILKNAYSDEIATIFGIMLHLYSNSILRIDWLSHRHLIDLNAKYNDCIHIGCHGGTSGIYGALRNENNNPVLGNLNLPPIESMFSDCFNITVKPEWERRIGYHLTAYENWNHNTLDQLKNDYLYGINKFINTFNLSLQSIYKYKSQINSFVKI